MIYFNDTNFFSFPEDTNSSTSVSVAKVLSKLRQDTIQMILAVISDHANLFDQNNPSSFQNIIRHSLSTRSGILYESALDFALEPHGYHRLDAHFDKVDRIVPFSDKKILAVCQCKTDVDTLSGSAVKMTKEKVKECASVLSTRYPGYLLKTDMIIGRIGVDQHGKKKKLQKGQQLLGDFLYEMTGDASLRSLGDEVANFIENLFQEKLADFISYYNV